MSVKRTCGSAKLGTRKRIENMGHDNILRHKLEIGSAITIFRDGLMVNCCQISNQQVKLDQYNNFHANPDSPLHKGIF